MSNNELYDGNGWLTTRGILTWVWAVGTFLLGLVILAMAGCPQYHVYAERKSGEAALAHAHSTKLIMVTQAEAEREAAQKRAEAIAIVGKASQQYPQYRQQEFIGAFANALESGKIQQIIYVPTEANIPIIEPGRIAAAAGK